MSTRPAKPRVEWVDYAKGICIFFVVMLHVTDHVRDRAGAAGWIEHVVAFALPFRMPDFFLISGLFLAAVIDRPWRLYLDRKVVHFVYFYALWMTLKYACFDLPQAVAHGTHGLAIVGDYGLRYLDPHGPLWFIHMLPIFFVVTRLTRRLPRWLIWAAAMVLHNLHVRTGWNVPDEGASRFVFFYTGYICARQVFAFAHLARTRTAFACGYLACWAAVNGALVYLGLSKEPGISAALGYAGALAVIVTAVLLSKSRWTAPVRYIGQHSLVVYLADFWLGTTAVRLFVHVIPDPGWLALLSTTIAVAGTIGLWRLVLRTPARFMYVRPRWLSIDPARRRGEEPEARGAPERVAAVA